MSLATTTDELAVHKRVCLSRCRQDRPALAVKGRGSARRRAGRGGSPMFLAFLLCVVTASTSMEGSPQKVAQLQDCDLDDVEVYFQFAGDQGIPGSGAGHGAASGGGASPGIDLSADADSGLTAGVRPATAFDRRRVDLGRDESLTSPPVMVSSTNPIRPASHLLATQPAALSSVRPSTATMGNIAPYRTQLVARIAEHWQPDRQRAAEVDMELVIAADGALVDYRLLGTNSRRAARELQKAVEMASFAPLPAWFKGDQLRFLIKFSSSPAPSD